MFNNFQEKGKQLARQNFVQQNLGGLEREVRDKTLGYIMAGLGFVAGLAWNDAIKTAIEALFPLQRDSMWVKFLYAAVITLVVVAGSLILARFMGKKDDHS